MKLSIAIDGPAGAGKSTIANLVAEKYSLMYINTGAMYRAVTLIALEHNISYTEVEKLCSLVKTLDLHFDGNNIIVNGKDITDKIYSPYISKNVSYYATIPEIRKILVDKQRKMSEKFNVIMDGRDIGTVVLKDASLKIFLNASAEKRAERRYTELKQKGENVDYNEILKDIQKRDYIDSNRKVNPLKKAEDAIEIDSSNLNIKEVVEVISKYIDELMQK